jgi:hypothetical protein
MTGSRRQSEWIGPSRALHTQVKNALVLAAVLLVGCGRGGGWVKGSFDQALQHARSRSTLLMVDFTADW